MESGAYAVEAVVEEKHWWFVGRRRLLAAEIREAGLSADARALDIGTGTGTNLRMLRDLGYRRVIGLDASDEAIAFCKSKGLGEVQRGDICALPFSDASFDLVLATDVIEHVDSDVMALAEVGRVLAPGGVALITVPAFEWLWGLQDDVALHKRRYRLGPLLRLVSGAGLSPRHGFYFNYLLCGPIWLARRIIRITRLPLASEGQVNTTLLNTLLSGLFALDVRTARWLRPPFGVSILVLARKLTAWPNQS